MANVANDGSHLFNALNMKPYVTFLSIICIFLKIEHFEFFQHFNISNIDVTNY